MRVLVQNCITRKFLGEDGLWLNNQAEAKVFRAGLEALDFCFANKLDDVQVVMHFDSATHQNIELPLLKPCRQVA